MAAKESSTYKQAIRNYERGYKAGDKEFDQAVKALSRADAKGEFREWYAGYYDSQSGNPKYNLLGDFTNDRWESELREKEAEAMAKVDKFNE